jgi:hypothetical protein
MAGRLVEFLVFSCDEALELSWKARRGRKLGFGTEDLGKREKRGLKLKRQRPNKLKKWLCSGAETER